MRHDRALAVDATLEEQAVEVVRDEIAAGPGGPFEKGDGVSH